jgi:hypothetical protein
LSPNKLWIAATFLEGIHHFLRSFERYAGVFTAVKSPHGQVSKTSSPVDLTATTDRSNGRQSIRGKGCQLSCTKSAHAQARNTDSILIDLVLAAEIVKQCSEFNRLPASILSTLR